MLARNLLKKDSRRDYMLHNSKESKVKGTLKKENNLFRDSPHLDPLSRGSQSIESK